MRRTGVKQVAVVGALGLLLVGLMAGCKKTSDAGNAGSTPSNIHSNSLGEVPRPVLNKD